LGVWRFTVTVSFSYLSTLTLLVESQNRRTNFIIGGFCSAFIKINSLVQDYRENLFHLRDFVYFLRYLRKHGKKDDYEAHFDPKEILKSILRNFNGVPSHIMEKIIQLFFDEIKQSYGNQYYYPYKDFKWSEHMPPTLDLIKESIDDKMDADENPNHAAFRYTLIIDPTDIQSSISILFSLEILKREDTAVCYVSDFLDDDNFLSKSRLISEIKQHMEVPLILKLSFFLFLCVFFSLGKKLFSSTQVLFRAPSMTCSIATLLLSCLKIIKKHNTIRTWQLALILDLVWCTEISKLSFTFHNPN